MGERMSDMHDPYDDQLRSARYKAERDQARQECERLQRKVECLEDDVENLNLELGEAKGRLRDSMPRDAYENRRAKWLRHIRECETALHKRNERIGNMGRHIESLKAALNEVEGSEEWLFSQVWQNEIRNIISEHITLFLAFRDACGMLGVEIEPGDPEMDASPHIAAAYQECKDELERRLMPEGMEWPRYDTGEPLKLDDEVAVKNCDPVTVRFISFDKNGFSVRHTGGCRVHWFTYGERVKRPAPKALAERGE